MNLIVIIIVGILVVSLVYWIFFQKVFFRFRIRYDVQDSPVSLSIKWYKKLIAILHLFLTVYCMYWYDEGKIPLVVFILSVISFFVVFMWSLMDIYKRRT